MKLLHFISSFIVVASLYSCDHKELNFDNPGSARYVTDVSITYHRDWEEPYDNLTDWSAQWTTLGLDFPYDSLRPPVPEGIRVTSYNSAGVRTDKNIAPYGEEIYLSPGVNSILFYNNDTEFIVFKDLDSFGQASATTRSRNRSTYKSNPCYTEAAGSRSEVTVSPPDELFGHYIAAYTQQSVTQPQCLSVAMRPLVFTYVVRHLFTHGLEYVALARGALAGMAGSVYLSNGHTSTDAVTVLYDCKINEWGVEAIVKSFGIPDFPNPDYSRTDQSFALNLEVRLNNGKILNFNFDITDQMIIQPHGGVITVDCIEISDDQGASGGSAFNVSVDGWGEFKDVPIDF